MKNCKKIIIFFIILFISLLLLKFEYLLIYKKINDNNNNNKIEYSQQIQISEQEKNDTIIVELSPKEYFHLNMSIIGDIMCHNSQYIDAYDTSRNTYDFTYAFDDLKEYISSADIAIGNLETTFAGSQRGYSNYPRFNSPEQLARKFKKFWN